MFHKNDFLPKIIFNKQTRQRFQRLNLYQEQAQKMIFDSVRYFKECGIKLIKLDFLYPPSLKTCKHMNKTRVEILREILTKIREVTGPKIHLISAISTLSPLVGLMDSVITGIDTTYPDIYPIPLLKRYNNTLLKENLANAHIRSAFHQKLWNNDLDCIVFNDKSGLSKDLVTQHTKLITKNSHSIWFGDNLEILKPYQLQIIN